MPVSTSLHGRLAPIHTQQRPRYKGGIIRGEKQDAVGHFPRRTRPFEHGFLSEFEDRSSKVDFSVAPSEAQPRRNPGKRPWGIPSSRVGSGCLP
jgi:hypothetical protein